MCAESWFSLALALSCNGVYCLPIEFALGLSKMIFGRGWLGLGIHVARQE